MKRLYILCGIFLLVLSASAAAQDYRTLLGGNERNTCQQESIFDSLPYVLAPVGCKAGCWVKGSMGSCLATGGGACSEDNCWDCFAPDPYEGDCAAGEFFRDRTSCHSNVYGDYYAQRGIDADAYCSCLPEAE